MMLRMFACVYFCGTHQAVGQQAPPLEPDNPILIAKQTLAAVAFLINRPSVWLITTAHKQSHTNEHAYIHTCSHHTENKTPHSL